MGVYKLSTEILVQLIMSLGVLPALFIFLLLYTLKQHEKDKQDSKQREEKLMNQLDKYNSSLERITLTNEKFDLRLSNIEKELNVRW